MDIDAKGHSRYALEMVMKIANKQKTIKELGQVGEVHERTLIGLKKPQRTDKHSSSAIGG
jgi:hypothetical protein